MQYLEFKEKLKEFLVFSLADVRKAAPTFYRSRLNEWQKKGYLKKIVRGHYAFSDAELNESVLFIIANKIYNPSYISFEMALSYYHFIPESVYEITSATSRKTYTFSTPFGEFFYRRIKPSLMFGYTLIPYRQYMVKIAEPEKALLDCLYINSRFRSENDFFEMRLNKDEILGQINVEKLQRYLALFQNQSLSQRTHQFLEYIHHA